MPPKVFVTATIPDRGLALLEQNFDVTVYPGPAPIPRDALLAGVRESQALLCIVPDQVDQEIMAAAPDLRIVSNHAVGYNNVDVAAATARGIWVTNTPGVLTDATADFTWALILAVSRRLVEADQLMRSGRFKAWEPTMMLGTELSGKKLGIIGAGRIGTAVAQRSVGWKMPLQYFSRNRNETLESDYYARRVELVELLRESDIVTIHTPLTEATQRMIGAAQLAMMRSEAILINTARGEIIDEPALVEALRSRAIAGAGLDVFEKEPRMADGLAALTNVVLAPHIGSATHHARSCMAEIAARNIIAWARGTRPVSIVNPEVLKN